HNRERRRQTDLKASLMIEAPLAQTHELLIGCECRFGVAQIAEVNVACPCAGLETVGGIHDAVEIARTRTNDPCRALDYFSLPGSPGRSLPGFPIGDAFDEGTDSV